MEKAKGVLLSSRWPTMRKTENIRLIQNVVSLEQSLLLHRFDSVGSIYYEADVAARQDTTKFCKSAYDGFLVGPTTSRIFVENGRKDINSDKGPVRDTAYDYIVASVRRERECIKQHRRFPRPQGIFGGPGCYKPTAGAKLAVLDDFEKVASYLLPKDTSVHVPVLWHGDLHHDNIFVDPDNPAKILSIIDWQTVHIAPLFQQARVPGFLDFNGPRPGKGFSVPSLPYNFETLNLTEKEKAKEIQTQQTLYKTYEMQSARQNPPVFDALRYSETLGSEIISLVSQVFNDGEPIIKGQLIQVALQWEKVVGPDGPPCPLAEITTPTSIATQEADEEKWGEGVQMLEDILEALGGAENGWEGWASHEDYDQLKQKLGIVKEQFLDDVAGNNEVARKEWESVWPFQDD